MGAASTGAAAEASPDVSMDQGPAGQPTGHLGGAGLGIEEGDALPWFPGADTVPWPGSAESADDARQGR